MRNLLEQVAQPQDDDITIYGLIDPSNGFVRYVGKSYKPEQRFQSHLRPSQLKSSSHKTHWLRNLLDSGKKPEMIFLEKIKECKWEIAEQKWISHYRNIPGYPPLTNMCPGGEGVGKGTKLSEEALRNLRERAAARVGKPMPPGTGEKISAANKGKSKSAEARLHFSDGQRNRWGNASEDEKQKMLKNLRNPQSPERIEQSSKRSRNAPRQENSSSQYRNVVMVIDRGKIRWRAGCIIKGKQICIGYFHIEEEAARARDQYVLKNIGEHIILNFPRSNYADNPSEIVVEKRERRYSQMTNKPNSSGYKGVTRNGKNGWTAGISYLGVHYRLGTHRTKEAAARAYDTKAIELFGDSAITNFPSSDYK